MKYIDLRNNIEYDTERMKKICGENRGFGGITRVYKSSDGIYFEYHSNVIGEKTLYPIYDIEAQRIVSGISKEAYKKEFKPEER